MATFPNIFGPESRDFDKTKRPFHTSNTKHVPNTAAGLRVLAERNGRAPAGRNGVRTGTQES